MITAEAIASYQAGRVDDALALSVTVEVDADLSTPAATVVAPGLLDKIRAVIAPGIIGDDYDFSKDMSDAFVVQTDGEAVFRVYGIRRTLESLRAQTDEISAHVGGVEAYEIGHEVVTFSGNTTAKTRFPVDGMADVLAVSLFDERGLPIVSVKQPSPGVFEAKRPSYGAIVVSYKTLYVLLRVRYFIFHKLTNQSERLVVEDAYVRSVITGSRNMEEPFRKVMAGHPVMCLLLYKDRVIAAASTSRDTAITVNNIIDLDLVGTEWRNYPNDGTRWKIIEEKLRETEITTPGILLSRLKGTKDDFQMSSINYKEKSAETVDKTYVTYVGNTPLLLKVRHKKRIEFDADIVFRNKNEDAEEKERITTISATMEFDWD